MRSMTRLLRARGPIFGGRGKGGPVQRQNKGGRYRGDGKCGPKSLRSKDLSYMRGAEAEIRRRDLSGASWLNAGSTSGQARAANSGGKPTRLVVLS